MQYFCTYIVAKIRILINMAYHVGMDYAPFRFFYAEKSVITLRHSSLVAKTQFYGSRLCQPCHILCTEQCCTGCSHDLGILCMEGIQRCSERYHTSDCNHVCDVCNRAGTDNSFKLMFLKFIVNPK